MKTDLRDIRILIEYPLDLIFSVERKAYHGKLTLIQSETRSYYGTVIILFDHIPLVCWLPVRVQLEQICVQ